MDDTKTNRQYKKSQVSISSYISSRTHQADAVTTAIKMLMSGKNKVLLELDAGTGKTNIIVELTEGLLKLEVVRKVLILTSSKMIADQIATTFYNSATYLVTGSLNATGENQIAVITYPYIRSKNLDLIQKFDLIIFDEAQYLASERIAYLFKNSESKFVGIIPSSLNRNKYPSLFLDVPISFSCSINDNYKHRINHLEKTSESYGQAVEKFAKKLLQELGCQLISDSELTVDIPSLNTDLMLRYKNQKIIVEIKAYQSRYISNNSILIAAKQLSGYKNTINESRFVKSKQALEYCLILFCELDDKQKKQLHEEYGITIWDIPNLLYFCGNNAEFSSELNELLYYPISDMVPEKPTGWFPDRSPLTSKHDDTFSQDTVESLEEKLRACKPGNQKKAAKEYEDICSDIIHFLFDSEFTQSSSQHKTGDDLFRMDLLCGIKGSPSFWELLLRHYNTRFVVFEYKNYSVPLLQNLIYITEKYLFNSALRNVAIIVSRKGFSRNAHLAALGCLKENGKLIIEITDDDLILMLHKKSNGEDPSDHLLYKLENLLMNVGK